jgi:hypothetical protein
VSKPLDQSQTLYDLGVMAERERIIKLLDAEFDRVFPMKDYPASNAILSVRAALIKGENK